MTTRFRDEQELNDAVNVSTVSGRTISVRPVQLLNTRVPMVLRPACRTMFVSVRQFEKSPSPLVW